MGIEDSKPWKTGQELAIDKGSTIKHEYLKSPIEDNAVIRSQINWLYSKQTALSSDEIAERREALLSSVQQHYQVSAEAANHVVTGYEIAEMMRRTGDGSH